LKSEHGIAIIESSGATFIGKMGLASFTAMGKTRNATWRISINVNGLGKSGMKRTMILAGGRCN
jgi:hypothetical protein